jgi:predicted alpha/beta superfamily hydrolase
MSCKLIHLALVGCLLSLLIPINGILAQNPATLRTTTLTGKFNLHHHFASRFLANERELIIYLPPGYDRDSQTRYPVLYFHDGQNLFDGATSYLAGQEWQLDETAERLIQQQVLPPLIIVGINNAGAERINEYTPSLDARFNKGGKADLYGRFLVEEVKPFIDQHYRTLPDAAHTGLGGSSLGGLVSLYLGLKYPTVFQRLAIVSPSVWWDNQIIVQLVAQLPQKLNSRIWLDIGTNEGVDAVPNTRLLRDKLLGKGWQEGQDLQYYEAPLAPHNEAAWAARTDRILTFLFAKP